MAPGNRAQRGKEGPRHKPETEAEWGPQPGGPSGSQLSVKAELLGMREQKIILRRERGPRRVVKSTTSPISFHFKKPLYKLVY